MLRLYDAFLRHAKHYAQMAAHAEKDLYLKGESVAGLALFDKERPQIDAGWDWALTYAGTVDGDALLGDYVNATASIGDLRYDARCERIPKLEAALAAARRQTDRRSEGAWLGNLGNAYASLSEVRRAIELYEQALIIKRAIGDRQGEANTSWNLGLMLAEQGDLDAAIDSVQSSVAIYQQINHPRAEECAMSLAHLRAERAKLA
jgi:tetratricopeptide (TPR) repeat protein